MERSEVYRILDDERQYQDTVRKLNENETRDDADKSIADFVIYMGYTLNKAKDSLYDLDEKGALAILRKVTALGVAAGEAFSFPERKNKLGF